MKNSNKWSIERLESPTNQIYNANFRIVENNDVAFPVCHLPNALSEKQPDALLEKQEQFAKLIANAPEMFEILKEWTDLFYEEDIQAKELIEKMLLLAKKSSIVLSQINGFAEW